MSSGIIPRLSSTALHVPTTGQMQIGEIAVNSYDGKMYLRGNNGADFVQQIGAPTAGVLIVEVPFYGVSGVAPIESFEFDNLVWLFSQGQLQSLVTWVHVPNAYSTGTQILMKLNAYTSDATSTNKFKLQATTTLVRSGTDAVNSTTNQYASTVGDQSITTTAYLNNQISLDLSSSTGTINSVAVSPGDMIKVQLSRVATTGTDSTVDLRVIGSSAQISFS